MKNLLVAVLLALFTILFALGDVEAKNRLGAGKSTGMQKDSVPKEAPKPPAQNTVAPAGAPATPAAAPSGMSRWLGPLAGLAAGGLLASMFMGGGFSGLKMMDILLFAGLAFGAFMLFRMFMRDSNGPHCRSGRCSRTPPKTTSSTAALIRVRHLWW